MCGLQGDGEVLGGGPGHVRGEGGEGSGSVQHDGVVLLAGREDVVVRYRGTKTEQDPEIKPKPILCML